MAGGLYTRVKTWAANEYLSSADLNAEFDNIINNCDALHLGGYSDSVALMKVTANPGATGSESLATSMAGELTRLRYVVKRMLGTGSTNWYDSPVIDLTQTNTLLGAVAPLAANRITSGRHRAGSNFPIFLVPDGTAATVNLKGLATNLTAYINSAAYTFAADVALSGLSLAPNSQNTCLVNDATLSGQEYSRLIGEAGTALTVDAMGTNIQALIGKYAGFKIVHSAVTEYFIGYVASATSISRCSRGYFFDSADAPIKRVAVSDDDTITLMKLTWIFVTTAGGLVVTYNSPIWSLKQPTSASIGDYWYDLANSTWKTYNGVAWVSAAATLAGMCVQDTAGCKAARSFEYYAAWNPTNTVTVEQTDNATIQARQINTKISVSGNIFSYGLGYAKWNSAVDMDTGVTLSNSTVYFLYVTEAGDSVISDIAPYDRTADLLGHYHPFNPWRCVGRVFSDGSSHFTTTVMSQEVWNNPSLPGFQEDYGASLAMIPDGYLPGDGAAVNRVQFFGLYSLYGINHGHGDNSTTFNLPDARARFKRGSDDMGSAAGAASRDPDAGARSAMATGGNAANVGSIQADALAAHSHTVALSANTGAQAGQAARGDASGVTGITSSTTGGNETRPINYNVNVLIRY